MFISSELKGIMFCVIFGIVIVAAVQRSTASTKWIDLTYQLAKNETPYWPGQQHWLHVGTHMDVPRHVVKSGISVEKVSIDNLHGEGIVVNVSVKVDKNPNAALEKSDLEEWEKKHGRMPDNPVVFMYCGRGKYWLDKKKYFGTDTLDNASTFNFPGLHENAAKWLIDNRKIKLFGVDSPSLDPKDGYKAHQVLLRAGVPGIENVANLHKLPPRGFEVFAFPMKIKDGTGAPTRVFAKITNQMDKVNSASMKSRVSMATVPFVMMLDITFMF